MNAYACDKHMYSYINALLLGSATLLAIAIAAAPLVFAFRLWYRNWTEHNQANMHIKRNKLEVKTTLQLVEHSMTVQRVNQLLITSSSNGLSAKRILLQAQQILIELDYETSLSDETDRFILTGQKRTANNRYVNCYHEVPHD